MNAFYNNNSPMWEIDFDWQGFEWLVPDDNHNNVVVFLRRDKSGKELVCAINFSPNAYEGYRFGCPAYKELVEVFNSDAVEYGGSGVLNTVPAPVSWTPSHDKESSVAIRIPPFGAVFLEGRGKLRAKPKKKAADAKEKKAPAKKAAAAKASVKKADAKPTEKKAAEKKAAEEKAVEKKPAVKKAAAKKTAEKKTESAAKKTTTRKAKTSETK